MFSMSTNDIGILPFNIFFLQCWFDLKVDLAPKPTSFVILVICIGTTYAIPKEGSFKLDSIDWGNLMETMILISKTHWLIEYGLTSMKPSEDYTRLHQLNTTISYQRPIEYDPVSIIQ